MKVFVTGATGHVGSAVARELASAGHEVTALLRSAGKTGLLVEEVGVRPAYGDMTIPASYRSRAAECDALVHAASQSDGDTAGADRTALDALLDAARTGDRPRVVVYTSGCWVLGDTGSTPADEEASPSDPAELVAWRTRHEEIVLEAGEEGFTTAVVRPGLVYGGAGSLLAPLFRSAREDGVVGYPGEGGQHWSLVHRGDLARLYRRILEEEAGGVFHGVDDMPVEAREVARAAGRAAGAGGDVRALSREESRALWGEAAEPLRLDQRVSTTRAREVGWRPEHPSFPEAADTAYREWRERRSGAAPGNEGEG